MTPKVRVAKVKTAVDIDKQISSANKSHMRAIDKLNLSRSVVDFLIPIANHWSGGRDWKRSTWHRAASVTAGSWDDVKITFCLSAQDRIAGMMEILEAIDSRYEFAYDTDNREGHSRTFNFRHMDLRISMVVEFKSSSTCKVVGTGEMVEKTRTECVYI